ncbi:MAG: ketoacyl-ACP synthase III [Nitrospinae bacterium]|nr:ketoacyl-ACP synthase III [Nitrospinota bacterium]
MLRAKIIGTGSYLPKKVMTNHDLEKLVDTSDEWIMTRTGIRERRIADKKEASSDLGIKAAREALANAGLKASDLELILVATATPDMIFPSTAAYVQHGLGAGNAAAMDISAVCTGFIFGLSIAEQYIKTGRYKTILVVGTEIMSRILDWTDRKTCVLFGDGAGAAIIQGSEDESGILSTHIYTDGSYADFLLAPGSGTRHGYGSAAQGDKSNCIHMKGNETFKVAVNFMSKVAREALESNGLASEDIDLFIPHQANQRIIEAIAKKLGVPSEKVFMNLHKYGNTSAASVPIALDEALRENRIKRGDLVLIVAFGGGLTWGASLIRW